MSPTQHTYFSVALIAFALGFAPIAQGATEEEIARAIHYVESLGVEHHVNFANEDFAYYVSTHEVNPPCGADANVNVGRLVITKWRTQRSSYLNRNTSIRITIGKGKEIKVITDLDGDGIVDKVEFGAMSTTTAQVEFDRVIACIAAIK